MDYILQDIDFPLSGTVMWMSCLSQWAWGKVLVNV